MTNYKEILRLYCSRNYSLRGIAKALGISRNTVNKCLDRVFELQMKLPIPESMTNEELTGILFPKKEDFENPDYCIPDFEKISLELKKPHMTRQLLWKEYTIAAAGTGLNVYSLSRFNALLGEFCEKHHIVITRDRFPGEVLELDWSGSSLTLTGKADGIEVKCHLFVAAFPYSGYFYAEAFADEKMHSWVKGIVDALKDFGGVPKILRPDNCKTATIKADKYEPELNTVMIELSEYYKTVTIPARVRKPTDKNTVESTVGLVTRNIIAALRNETFYSLNDMNEKIFEMTEELNNTDFTKKMYSRTMLFEAEEKPALLPLPSRAFEFYERTTAKVAPDYHVAFDSCYYSVPSEYCGQTVMVRANVHDVIIKTLTGDKEIATHTRGFYRGQKITNPDHMPDYHKGYKGWSGDKFRSEASEIGENARLLIDRVLSSREYEAQAYKTCRGILNFKQKYGRTAFETAAKIANECGFKSYKSFASLIRDDQSRLTRRIEREEEESDDSHLYLSHSNIRKEDK